MNTLLSSMLASMGIDTEALMKTATEAQAKLEDFDNRLKRCLDGIERIERQLSELRNGNERSAEPGSSARHDGSTAIAAD